MKLLLFIGFSFFCFDQVILMSTGRTEGVNIPGEILESKEFQLCLNNQTELMDMDDDCQLMMLENLDFISLLSVAEINSRYKSLVGEIVKTILRKKMIHITLWDTLPPNRPTPPSIIVGNNSIEIYNLTVAERFVKDYGHFIEKLEIINYCYKPYEPARSIYSHVNLHCSKTLREITLENSLHNYLDEFTNTFENVKNLYIREDLETKRRLNEVFPAVRQLYLRLHSISNPESINVNYKHLEDLGIHVYEHREYKRNQWTAGIISKNSQIRSLTLGRLSAEYIKIAADSIPKLERLNLDSMQSNHNESINFRNVKELVVKGTSRDVFFENVHFGNVEEVTVNYLRDSMSEQTGFFQSNKRLKRLRLLPDGYTLLNNNKFERFARSTATLQDIFIGGACLFELQRFLPLLNNNSKQQLKKVEIEFLQSSYQQEASNALRDAGIGLAWFIEGFEKKLILMKKQIFA